MKKLNIFACLLVVTVLLVGCSTEVKRILPKQDGMWLSTSILVNSYVNSTLDSSYTITDGSTYTFDKNGTGTRVDAGGASRNLTWGMNPSGEIIIICYPTVSSTGCADYLVISSTKNRQEWRVTTVGAVNGEWIEEFHVLTRIE